MPQLSQTDQIMLLVRVVAGGLIFVHGFGIFNAEHMKGNVAWLTDLHFPAPLFMAHLGKLAEFIGGICILFGLLTRVASFALVINMAVITFILGSGKIFTEDELPFLLMTLFAYLFLSGSGKWSLDRLLSVRKSAT